MCQVPKKSSPSSLRRETPDFNNVPSFHLEAEVSLNVNLLPQKTGKGKSGKNASQEL
ncbi:hypothetical protein MY8738_007368 [Beauveria namnaoensis]